METPSHWEKYLLHLDKVYERDLKEWEEEAVRKVEEYNKRPWYQKIMQSEDDIKMWHEWERPEKWYDKYQPTTVGYFNWDVNNLS